MVNCSDGRYKRQTVDGMEGDCSGCRRRRGVNCEAEVNGYGRRECGGREEAVLGF